MPSSLFARYPLSRPTLVVIHDTVALVAALPLAIMLRESRLPDADRAADILAALPILVVAALVAALVLGSYRAVWRYMGAAEIVRLAQLALLTVLVFYLGQFLVDRLASLPRSAPVIHFLTAMFLLLGSRILYGEWRRRIDGPSRPAAREPLLLVGAGDGAALFIQMLEGRADRRYEVAGIVCDSVTRHRSIHGIPVLGGLADLPAVLATLRVQGMSPARLVVTRPHHELGQDAVRAVMERAYAERIPVEQLPDLMRFRSETHAPGAPPEATALPDDVYPRLKRGFDIAAAGGILLFLSPLLLLAATAVALFVQRPVLFVQRRPGQGGRPFALLKLRTMRDPTAPDGRTLSDAARTPLAGRLLRRTRLDELPQLWNVLRGDMAIIGPRPLVRADLDAMPDHGLARSRIKPGITGWAQVNGGHQLSGAEKLALDLWYISHASIALDARIVARTIQMMLLGERRDEAAILRASTPDPLLVSAE